MADEPKSWAAMSADALREGAILVLVFGLLDKYMFAADGPSGVWTAAIVAIALFGFVLGGVLERFRRRT